LCKNRLLLCHFWSTLVCNYLLDDILWSKNSYLLKNSTQSNSLDNLLTILFNQLIEDSYHLDLHFFLVKASFKWLSYYWFHDDLENVTDSLRTKISLSVFWLLLLRSTHVEKWFGVYFLIAFSSRMVFVA
jgi:hypothetical protein